MTGFSHPFVVAQVAEQHRADYLAQADRDRLARSVQPDADSRLMWPDRAAVVAVVVVLALLLAAGTAVGAA
jgi:hypothetical protein